MDNKEMIDLLNDMIKQEHACAIRYRTHAALVRGPNAEAVAARLKEISDDEIEHADILRDRVTALGGVPTMDVYVEDLKYGDTVEEMLKINIDEERQAISHYLKIFEKVPASNAILYQAIQELIRDEQEHLEELENLLLEDY